MEKLLKLVDSFLSLALPRQKRIIQCLRLHGLLDHENSHGRTRWGAAPPRPPLRVPPLRGRGRASMGEALSILHLLAFPFLRSGTVVYLGGGSNPLAPPRSSKNTKLKGNYV